MGSEMCIRDRPLIASVYDIDINSFVVRKEQKEYGLCNWLEGVPNSKKVLLIDDLCNSGISMGRAYNILSNMGVEFVPYAFSIVNKSNVEVHTQQRLNSDMYLPPEFKMVSLFTLDDFNLTSPSH